MKRLFLLFTGFFLFLMLVNCASYYSIIKETPGANEVRKYNKIYMGWMDLNETKWQEFGYESKEKWVAVIDDLNLKGIPKYLKGLMPEKTFIVAKSKNDHAYKDCDLIVKFVQVDYVPATSSAAQVMFGYLAGSDYMDLSIEFIDGKTSKTIYTVNIRVESKGGIGYSSMGFEGRVNNAVYNAIYFLYSKMG
jgi:hypothetical protein